MKITTPLATTLTTLFLFTLIAMALGCGATTSTEQTTTQAKLYTFTSGADGFDTHSHYLDTGEEVIIFDAQFTPKLANDLMADIKKRTSSPITHVVITHPNPDKFNGASVFQANGAKVIASKATEQALADVHAYKKAYFIQTAKMFTEQTYPSLPKVDTTFEETYTLNLKSKHTITLKVLKHAGVSSTQTVAHIPSIDALVVGDLIHHKVHAWLEGGIRGKAPKLDLQSWRNALGELQSYGEVKVYAGRGDVVTLKEAVAAQDQYLKRVSTLQAAYLKDHQAPYDQQDHAALAKQIKEAFPKYRLGYMVDYSAYGLFIQ